MKKNKKRTPLRIIKLISFYILGLLTLLIIAVFVMTARDRAIDYDVDLTDIDIPKFKSQKIDYKPSYDKTKTIPFTAGCIIDIDNDGVEELFIGGGIDQQDAFFKFENGSFSDITVSTGWSKETPDDTYGAVSLDLDKDGDNDLLITRESGVWHYDNNNGKFEGSKLNLDFDEKSVPLSVAICDLNRDGLYDMYVCGYIARKHVEGETIFNKEYGGVSSLYINQGDNIFKNITKEAGLYHQHNTFQGIFIDVDGDDLEDLVVAQDTGTVKTWKNLGDLKFEDVANPTSDYFSYPMGIAVSDYNNDGLPDFYFSNVGSTPPTALVRGDLTDDQVLNKKWIMFENKGGFKFEDVAEKTKLADYEFSWGAIFEDFNLDGRDDLVVSENYVGFPTHILPAWRLDGRFMVQNSKGEFAAVGEKSGVQNRLYSISPLTADFNQDGSPDLVHVNLLGPQKVFINEGSSNHYLKVKLANNVDSIGAKVSVELDNGKILHGTFISGEGLCSDQSHVLIFGLESGHAKRVQVQFLNGKSLSKEGEFKNETLNLL